MQNFTFCCVRLAQSCLRVSLNCVKIIAFAVGSLARMSVSSFKSTLSFEFMQIRSVLIASALPDWPEELLLLLLLLLLLEEEDEEIECFSLGCLGVYKSVVVRGVRH